MMSIRKGTIEAIATRKKKDEKRRLKHCQKIQFINQKTIIAFRLSKDTPSGRIDHRSDRAFVLPPRTSLPHAKEGPRAQEEGTLQSRELLLAGDGEIVIYLRNYRVLVGRREKRKFKG